MYSHDTDEICVPFADLFQNQLAAMGLEGVANKVAAGSVLELADVVPLSGASLPLLGRLVQFVRSTGFSRPERSESPADAIPPEGGTTSAELPIQQLTSVVDLPHRIAQPLTDWESFCRALLDMRCKIDAANGAVAWHPEVAGPPDENAPSDGNFTGVDVLRAIALARLVLPPNVQIVAPLNTLGPKLAQVALEFGATHLGYVAVDGQQFDSPLMASQSVLDELRGSSSPTKLREEMQGVL